jgi:hypothetical protein
MSSAIASERSIQFLRNLQNLLEEGGFSSTYKFALLHALADIAVEVPGSDGGELEVATDKIAAKFIEYYWRQARPFGVREDSGILIQNNGGQAAVLNRVATAQSQLGGSYDRLRNDPNAWGRLIKEVKRIVCDMPLWKLQNRGNGHRQEFIYVHPADEGMVDSITLEPGVATCLREFHGLIINMIRGAWVQKIQAISANQPLLGNDSQLMPFLFGTERADLGVYVPILHDHQEGRCFYCDRRMKSRGEVDHFIPWARYPNDFANNFVLAHKDCNNRKRDHLAATEHLRHWCESNIKKSDSLESVFEEEGIFATPEVSLQVTRWAYEGGYASGALMWHEGKELLYFDPQWRDALAQAGVQ